MMMQAAWVQEERCDYKQFVIARGKYKARSSES